MFNIELKDTVTYTVHNETKNEVIDRSFDNINAMKQFVHQVIVCMEANVNVGVFKNLKVTDWQTQPDDSLILSVEVDECLPSNDYITHIHHEYVAKEKRFTI